MRIFVGTDHQGFYLRNSLVQYLKNAGYDVEDEGDEKLDPDDDFPVFARRVVSKVLASDDKNARGILICGSGQGMCMAANRFKGIRAVLGYDKESARSSRNDEDSNVLCLPSHVFEKDEANVLVEVWLNTEFAGSPRFVRRIREIDEF